jgi:C5HC2 zinc finger
MGPNIGEAVNFATHDWIEHGSDANERYRSFARPAVFSHDRLTFTMAYHLSEQKSYKNCKLLLKELERVVAEEMQLRRRLVAQGVRDVSEDIQLPPNRLDQLDEDSADYDDKRLCHACKHVCFFSAVACECSRSKVSCLRHSHYMCRCPVERRYLMVWSTEEELQSTLSRVTKHCEVLKPTGVDDTDEGSANAGEGGGVAFDQAGLDPLPPVAAGVERDLEAHKNEPIRTDPAVPKPKAASIIESNDTLSNSRAQAAAAAEVTTDEDRDEDRDGGKESKDVIVLDDSDDNGNNDDDDEIEVVAVVRGYGRPKVD